VEVVVFLFVDIGQYEVGFVILLLKPAQKLERLCIASLIT
ncbi:MAG: hypothetical protein QG657_2284, partial [Acidobacteriota bacterium]|nr:hypothetical protein [Acidobacteriota bacterium]